MYNKKIDQLVLFGEKISVKVTHGHTIDGKNVVWFRDYEYENFVLAALHLQFIQKTELVDSLETLCF